MKSSVIRNLRKVYAGFFFVISIASPASGADWKEKDGVKMLTGKPLRFDQSTATIDELSARTKASLQGSGLVEPKEIPNKFKSPALQLNTVVSDKADPLAHEGIETLAPLSEVSAPGPSNNDNGVVIGGLVTPPDTTGDVGNDHVVMYTNLVWAIYNKQGQLQAGPFPGNSFWAGFGGDCETENSGDPIVLFDHDAQRWVFSQFAVNTQPFLQCFAISETDDPAGPYTRYAYEVVPGDFNDYPKIGVWTDGAGQSAYHATLRQFTNGQVFAGIDAVAFDRDAMLAGDPNAGFVTFRLNTNGNPDGIMPAHLDGGDLPSAGTCGLYGAADNGNPDGYRIWEFCTDWINPANSSISAKSLISQGVPPWNEINSVPQPAGGGNLDALSFFTSYRFSTRFFPGEGLRGIMTHTVSSSGLASLRWTTFNLDDPNGITVEDTGTHAPNDGVHRWMAAATFDKVGNIGMGYTASSSSVFPSVRFTGRETTDPAGTMQTEASCISGTGVQTGASRWGDYSSTSVDPVDGCTFWTFQEYVEMSGNFQWNTRMCSFKFASCDGDTGGGENEPPVADAGDDFSVTSGSGSVTIDGSASFDPDGTIATFQWESNSNRLRLSNADTAVVTASIPPRLRSQRLVTLTLTVTDNDGAVSTDTMILTINP